ncbi:hypothetical protein GBF38_018199, partial [Nibea albiflora]
QKQQIIDLQPHWVFSHPSVSLITRYASVLINTAVNSNWLVLHSRL